MFSSAFANGVRAMAAVCFCLTAVAFAGEKGNEGDERPRIREIGPDGLPLYKHPYDDGLYSTVTAMNTFWVPENKKLKKTKIKVPGFRKEVTVYSQIQEHTAPLVVIMMGVDGKVDGAYGDLFPYWYAEAGFHVLTFDSSFTPLYPEYSGQGVVGNFEAEAGQAGAIVGAFLSQGGVKDKISKVGVIGISFGATQALLMAAQAKEGKLPFELSGCLALSPPAKLKTTAQIVDRFFVEDRWGTTMIELAKKFGPHAPVAEGVPIPFSQTEIRAALGFVFRDGLTQVVDRNDRFYRLKILPSGDGDDNRESHAEATSFGRYMEEFAAPYWIKKGAIRSPEDLWDMADLSKILPRLPDYAEVIVAANDPFNSQSDLAEARAADTRGKLTILPRGGHLGFIAADWTLVKSLRIFGVNVDLTPARPAAIQGGK